MVQTAPGRRGRLHHINSRVMLHTGLLAAGDVAAMYIALLLAHELRIMHPPVPVRQADTAHYAMLAAAVSPLWVMAFAVLGLYSRDRRGLSGQLGRIVLAAAAGIASLIIIDYFDTAKMVFPSRSVPVYAFLLGALLAITFRGALRVAIRIAYSRGLAVHRVVLLGADPVAAQLADAMAKPSSGYEIVAVVCAQADGGLFHKTIPIYRDFESAIKAVGESVDQILQADTSIDREEVARLIAWSRAHNVAYRFVPDLFGVYAAASRLRTMGELPVLQVRETALEGWYSVGKRLFDLTVGAITLLLSAPVFLAVALAVKLRDPSGPVFYAQTRIGRGGKPIRVLKFRSMLWRYSTGPDRPYADALEAFRAMGRPDLCAEFARDQKVKDDPRVSGIGRVLRATSLDELPQLINVVRGDLSLIGPRPITPEELERYGASRYHLLAMRPGVTGLWQVSGRSEISYGERVKLDVSYAENWTFALDMKILAKTPRAVVAKKGAV